MYEKIILNYYYEYLQSYVFHERKDFFSSTHSLFTMQTYYVNSKNT